MSTHVDDSPIVTTRTATALVILLATGAAGVAAGGPLWGFLGAGVLFACVWWIYHMFEAEASIRETEQYYEMAAKEPITVHARARVAINRALTHKLIPLSEAETAYQ